MVMASRGDNEHSQDDGDDEQGHGEEGDSLENCNHMTILGHDFGDQ